MIKGKVIYDGVFIGNDTIIKYDEAASQLVTVGGSEIGSKLVFKLPSSWNFHKKVALIKSSAGFEEYLPIVNGVCVLPDKFKVCADITVQVITKDQRGNMKTTNAVKLR